METRQSVEGPFGTEFPAICNHWWVMTAWSCKTWKLFLAIFAFFGKTTPYSKIFKILFRKFSPPHRSTLLCSNVVKICPTGNWWNRALFAWPKKIRLPVKLWLLFGWRPKLVRAPKCGAHYSRFHPNRFTFGGVTALTAERVTAVFLAHRVFSPRMRKYSMGQKKRKCVVSFLERRINWHWSGYKAVSKQE